MNSKNVMMIDGVQYAPVEQPAEVRIVIAQRGWVFVGRWSQDGENVTLTNAHVIRRWGTTAGIGELALNGPTGETTLDPAGTVRLHELGVVAALDCEESSWANKV